MNSLDVNHHVHGYVRYYVEMPHAPKYAVLLNGPWGVGKTHLTKKLLANLPALNNSYAYITLYGLESTAEIDEALVAAIYPMISNKYTKIAGRVLKTALKFGNIETDITASEMFLDKSKVKLFVFDDLERCKLPIGQVLGYLNEFVEHDGCKVLILANEAEIDSRDEYRRIKEKLIGKTLEVQPSLISPLMSFLEAVADEGAKQFLFKHISDLTLVFKGSELNNLRILQQSIWDFERFYHVLPGKYRANENAMAAVFNLFFALSFEIKSGRLIGADILARRTESFSLVQHSIAEIKSFDESQKRYPLAKFYDTTLSSELWVDVICRGVIDVQQLSESLERSSYFVQVEEEPAWRTVWHSFLSRTDEQFQHAFVEMERQFRNKEFRNIGEILHVCGLRLWLSDIQVLEGDRGKVLAEMKEYIDHLYDSGLLEPKSNHARGDVRPEGYGGLGIMENKTEEYREFFRYLNHRREAAAADQLPRQAESLLEELREDVDLFYRRVCVTNGDDNLYYNVPIFASIDPERFVRAVLALEPRGQDTALSVFRDRYSYGGHQLKEELPWLIAVRDELRSAAQSVSKIEGHRISRYLTWYFNPILDDTQDEDDSE